MATELTLTQGYLNSILEPLEIRARFVASAETDVVPFNHYIGDTLVQTFETTGVRDLVSQNSYWAIQIANVYELFSDEDFDGEVNAALVGLYLGNVASVADEVIRDFHSTYTFSGPTVGLEDAKARVAAHEVMHGVFGGHPKWWVGYYGIMAHVEQVWLTSSSMIVHPLAYPAIQNLLKPIYAT